MRSRLAQNLALAAVGLLVGLGVLEIGFRLFRPPPNTLRDYVAPDPVAGWRPIPNITVIRRRTEYRTEIRINSHGWRDVEHAYRKPGDSFRIVVLGDSFMEAFQVKVADSFPRRLERAIRAGGYSGVEVINLGVSGYGTYQEYLTFREEGVRYRPDLVILAMYPENDLIDNTRELAYALWGDGDPQAFGRPYLVPTGSGWTELPPDYDRALRLASSRTWWRRSAIYGVASALGRRISEGGADQAEDMFLAPFRCELAPVYERAWRTTDELVGRLDRVVSAAGARLVLAYVPARVEVEGPERSTASEQSARGSLCLDPSVPASRVTELSRRLNLPLLDWLSAFRSAPARGAELFYRTDRHWTPSGHALAAREAFRILIERKLLPEHRRLTDSTGPGAGQSAAVR